MMESSKLIRERVLNSLVLSWDETRLSAPWWQRLYIFCAQEYQMPNENGHRTNISWGYWMKAQPTAFGRWRIDGSQECPRSLLGKVDELDDPWVGLGDQVTGSVMALLKFKVSVEHSSEQSSRKYIWIYPASPHPLEQCPAQRPE